MNPSQCRAWSTVEFTQPAEFWERLESMQKSGVPFIAIPRTLEIQRAFRDDDEDEDGLQPPLPAPTALRA